MPRDYRVYLDDILEAASRIQSYTTGLTHVLFSGDLKTLDAAEQIKKILDSK